MFNKRFNRFQLYKIVFIISFIMLLSFILINININNINKLSSSAASATRSFNNNNNNNNYKINNIYDQKNNLKQLNDNLNIKYIKRNNINKNNNEDQYSLINSIDSENIMNRECEYIDLVYTWVNGSDPELLKLKSDYLGNKNFEPHRFRDIGGLKYSLRSVNKFAPWIKNIYIITANQIPTWFNIEKPGNIKFIFHNDYFFNKSHLPTFNSNSIESNFWNLPEEVSNCFLYLNDDVFFRKPINPTDFFDLKKDTQVIYQVNEKVHSSFEPEKYDEYFKIFINTNRLLDEVWNEKKERILPDHGVQVFNRKILLKMSQEFTDPLFSTSSNRKREPNDIPISFVYNQFAKRYSNYTIGQSNSNLYIGLWNQGNDYSLIDRSINLISKEKNSITVCVNDGFDFIDDIIDKKLTNFYESTFPIKGDYEL